jgi:hypothetical protein
MSADASQSREAIEKRNLAPLLVPTGQVLQRGKLYLHLNHGRNTPDEELEDWGFEGPTFGPLDYFHITYLSRFAFSRGDADHDLSTTQDMFVFDEKYYGDVTVFIAEGTEHG